MDLVTITQEQKKVSLLSLPRSDLVVASDKEKDNSTATKENQENESPHKSNSELMLMQLPKGVKMEDLATGCYFVAPRETTTTAAAVKGSPSKQVCLVMENPKQSYSVSRLETSNVLVLAPPVDDDATTTVEAGVANTQEPASKKAKLESLLPVPTRLLKPGGSGASFLELRSKPLRVGDLAKLLQGHVFDPYHTNHYRKKAVGRSLVGLANQLQCSKGQVEDALQILRSFPLPGGGSRKEQLFGVLGEEVLQESQNALIATLAESDDFADYANKGVVVGDFVAQALERLPLDQTYPQQEHVLRYALTTLLKGKDEDLSLLVDAAKVQVDVTKVAAWLAHRLFQAQSKPWEESRFCVRWQSELPGVGPAYQVSPDMLRGVAIRFEASSLSPQQKSNDGDDVDQGYWKYYPASKLPLNAEQRFQAMFKLQDQWSSEELEPYLDALVKDSGLSPAEILLQYTTHTASPRKGENGTNVKLYSLKR